MHSIISKKQLSFKINDYITLKLENGHTNVYVEYEFFKTCNFISLYLPKKHFDTYNILEKKAKQSNQSIIAGEINISLTLEEEFHEYCNRFHAWVDHKYDSRILPVYFAFPLMKKLVEADDIVAKKVFKEEIAQTIVNGRINEVYFLKFNNYFFFLDHEEIEVVYRECMENKNLANDLLVLHEFVKMHMNNAYKHLDKVLRYKLNNKLPLFNNKLMPDKSLYGELVRNIIIDLFVYQGVEFMNNYSNKEKKSF